MNTKEIANEYSHLLDSIYMIYDNYAKANHLSYTTLSIIHMCYEKEKVTQKMMCESLFLPKQTINSSIKQLEKEGIIEMTNNPEDHRSKYVKLTDKGKEFASKVVPPVLNGPENAFKAMSDTEQEQLVSLTKKYFDNINKSVNKILETDHL